LIFSTNPNKFNWWKTNLNETIDFDYICQVLKVYTNH